MSLSAEQYTHVAYLFYSPAIVARQIHLPMGAAQGIRVAQGIHVAQGTHVAQRIHVAATAALRVVVECWVACALLETARRRDTHGRSQSHDYTGRAPPWRALDATSRERCLSVVFKAFCYCIHMK